jgi:hypothetical protein
MLQAALHGDRVVPGAHRIRAPDQLHRMHPHHLPLQQLVLADGGETRRRIFVTDDDMGRLREDADVTQRRISVLAPLGTALIGYRAGDVVEWAMPGGTRRLRIETLIFQPEAAAQRAMSA